MNRFGRNLGIGILGHVVLVALLALGLFAAVRLGGEGGAMAAALSFLPVLIGLAALYLLILLVIAAVPALRARTGSAGGLLLGWLVGAGLVTGGFALLFQLA
ncbi:hypothetical protein [Catenuloplanes japonicus]|uniref:hypothetical protein n=1 Tax=Catenuloplanes japonicus TaxID=33876 RepID=UPI0005274A63|nr:hypothetical protein [Catenuloplanes japonicus]